MKTYVLLTDGKIKNCLEVFEPTKESPYYHLQISRKPEIYATGPNWGRMVSKEDGVAMFFFPLTDARLKEANAIFAAFLEEQRAKKKKKP